MQAVKHYKRKYVVRFDDKVHPYGFGASAAQNIRKKTTKKTIRQIVKGMKETNYLYNASGLTPDTGALNKVLLNGCQQGDALGTRIGNSITLNSVDIKFCLNYNWTDATHIYGAYDDIIGIWIVVDTQPNNAVMTDADFGADGVTCNALMRIDWDNRKRFKVIYHKVVQYKAPQQTNANPTAAANYAVKTWHVHKKLNDTKTEYNGNAGTIADITRNSLYLIVAGYNTYQANYYAPQLSFTRRVYFKE